MKRRHPKLGILPLILYRRFEAIFNESFAHHGIKPYYAVKCDDARTAILLANQGMGVALVPESAAKLDQQSSHRLVDYQPWKSTIQLIWPRNQQLSPLTRRVVRILRQKPK